MCALISVKVEGGVEARGYVVKYVVSLLLEVIMLLLDIRIVGLVCVPA